MNNGRKEGRRKWKKNVKYGELQKTRKKLYIRANCCEVREDATELPIHVTNLFEGGNTRVNKFP